jgi:hypothetical protein
VGVVVLRSVKVPVVVPVMTSEALIDTLADFEGSAVSVGVSDPEPPDQEASSVITKVPLGVADLVGVRSFVSDCVNADSDTVIVFVAVMDSVIVNVCVSVNVRIPPPLSVISPVSDWLLEALTSSDTVMVVDSVRREVLLYPDASSEIVTVALSSGDAVRVCVLGVAECWLDPDGVFEGEPVTESTTVTVAAVSEGSNESVVENDLLFNTLSVGVSVSVMSDDSVGDVEMVLASTNKNT